MPRRIFPAVCRKPRTHSRNEDGSGAGQVLLPKPRTHSRMLLQRLPSWSDELFTPCVESHAPAPRSPCRQRALLVPPPSLVCHCRLLVSRKSCPRLKTKSVTQTSMRLAPGVSSSNSWRPCSPRAVHTQSSKVLCHPHAVLRLHEVSSWSK